MNTWMVPRNKRTLYHIPDTLFLFLSGIGGGDWSGDRSTQRKFEELLEEAGLKARGQPYDPNSGGARTYKAQLECLGLLFFDDATSPNVYRPTVAGEEILNGSNPWPILRWQLLKFQYPSPYSLKTNVRINADFNIRPFYFLVKLLDEDELGYLTKEEVGKIILVYGESSQSFDDVKNLVLEYRETGDKVLPDTFLQDSSSPRIGGHNFSDRVAYLEDKANIFFNYLESVRLAIRPRSKSQLEFNPDMADLIEKFEREEPSLIGDPENQYRFQRRYGLPPGRQKDTRRFTSGAITSENIKERLVMKTFFDKASKNLVLEIDEGLLDAIESATAVPQKEVAKILERKNPQGLDYFEERYLDMISRGKEKSTEFELATAEIFETAFDYIAKHIGDITPDGRKGGNPDVVIISEELGYCGIIDAKAYMQYSISNDHRNRMLYNYIPNYEEHIDDEELSFFLYVSGGFSRNFSQQVRELAEKSGVDGAGISAKILLKISRLARSDDLDHDKLRDIFTENSEITLSEVIA